MDAIKRHGKRILLEGLGWLLVIVGIAALVLPGPGILSIFAGMALLSTQYEWAERRLEPVRRAALQHARELPAEIERFLNAGVHPLRAGRAVYVGRVACEENATHTQPVHHPAVQTKM